MRSKINILLHGVPKSGKTLFAVRRNPGVLVLDTEGSSRLIIGIKRHEITKMSDMDKVLDRIKSGEISTVVIDTLDELVNNFSKKEAKQKSTEFVNKLGLLTQPGWGYMRDRFLSITRSYRDAGADVLTICHSELKNLPNGTKKWNIKLPSDYAREVMGMMDVVGFTEIITGSDGEKIFRVNFSPSSIFDAGVRAIYDAEIDKLYSPLPEYLDNTALVDVIAQYDSFLSGEGKKYATRCVKCAKEGKVTEAVDVADDNKPYCTKHLKAYEEWKKGKVTKAVETTDTPTQNNTNQPAPKQD
jgi:hypothetical protein